MKVGIIGAGTMGGGIAQVFAQSGHEVLLCDINDELAQKGKARIVKSLDKLVAQGKPTEDVNELLLKIMK